MKFLTLLLSLVIISSCANKDKTISREPQQVGVIGSTESKELRQGDLNSKNYIDTKNLTLKKIVSDSNLYNNPTVIQDFYKEYNLDPKEDYLVIDFNLIDRNFTNYDGYKSKALNQSYMCHTIAEDSEISHSPKDLNDFNTFETENTVIIKLSSRKFNVVSSCRPLILPLADGKILTHDKMMAAVQGIVISNGRAYLPHNKRTLGADRKDKDAFLVMKFNLSP